PGAARRAVANLLGAGPLAGIESRSSAPVPVTPGITVEPSKPEKLTPAITEAGVELAWRESKGEDVIGYYLERRTLGPDGKPLEGWEKITPDPVVARSYRDRDVKPGMSYEYRVRGVDSAGKEGP